MDNDLFTLPPEADPQLIRAEVFISTGEFANAAARQPSAIRI